jgi:hypothetical protein
VSAPRMHRGARVRSATAAPQAAKPADPPAPACSIAAAPPPVADTTAVPLPIRPLAESREVSWEKFWFVWSPSEQRPQRRHASLESAQREAGRLHRMYGKDFLVFEARLIPTPIPEEVQP